MKTRIKNLFTRLGAASTRSWVLPVLMAGLGVIVAGPVTAQTFTNLYSFTATHTNSSDIYTNSDGAYPRSRIDFIGQHPLWDDIWWRHE